MRILNEPSKANSVRNAVSVGLYEHGPAQLWTAKPNGELDWVNGTVLDYFGRTFADMVKWGWSDVVHPDDFENVGERWVAAIETGNEYEVRFRLKRHDGAYRLHAGRARAVRDANGEVTAWVGANLDLEGGASRA